MKALELLAAQADYAFAELLEAIAGVTQPQAWAVLPQGGPEDIHTDGSVQGVVLHVASCKRMYGSIGFRSTEVRWRDCAGHLDAFEPSWPAAVEYLHDSHRYWVSTWKDLRDEDLVNEVPRHTGELLPAWKIIEMMNHHDAWHGGQIALLRYALGPSDTPPPKTADDIRQYCRDLPSW